jgi:hypothetical protein
VSGLYIAYTRCADNRNRFFFEAGGAEKGRCLWIFWGFLLLLLLLVGIHVAAADVFAARYGLGMAAIWSDIANVHTTVYLA